MATKLASVVTGASSGIGAALSKRLLNDGWKVAMISRSIDKMENLISNHEQRNNAIIIGADLSDSTECKNACQKVSEWLISGDNKLDLLVNNAGAAKLNTTLENVDIDSWNWSFNLNVTSAMLMSKYLHEHMLDNNNNGSIINMGSISGVQPFVGSLSYCTCKAAIDHMTRCMALELKDKGIRVNCIRPSTIETNFHENGGWTKEKAKDYYNKTASLHNTGLIGDVNDVIELILFFADYKKSRWITGQCVTMDGGRLLMSPNFL